MPMPNHCLDCEKPVEGNNILCVYCLEAHIQLSVCCNAPSVSEVIDGTGLCNECKEWSEFDEDDQIKRPAYRF